MASKGYVVAEDGNGAHKCTSIWQESEFPRHEREPLRWKGELWRRERGEVVVAKGREVAQDDNGAHNIT